MIKYCLVCNESFKTKPAEVRKGKGKYCSKKCYYLTLQGNGFFKNKKHSLETKTKISKIHKGNHHSPKTEFKKGQCSGSKNYRWKGGIYIDKDGYKRLKVGKRYILEHRLVMEKHIDRLLNPSEMVHHIDNNIRNNHITNLLICTRSEHRKIHSSK